jgi:sorbitol/mannitol transport system permease protein
VTTNGGPSTTNIPFRVFELAVNANDVGAAAAGGIVAVILANIVAVFLVRMIGKNLEA